MKDILSQIVKQAGKPETFLPNQEVNSLIELDGDTQLSNSKSFRPKRILRQFKPLKVIIMTTIIGIALIAVSQLISVADSNYNPKIQRIVDIEKAGDNQDVKKKRTVDSAFTISSSDILDIGSINPTKNSNVPESTFAQESVIQKESNEDSEDENRYATETSYEPSQRLPESYQIDKPIIKVVSISNKVLDCFGIDSTIRSYEFMCSIGVWGSNIFRMEAPHTLAFTGVFSWNELRITFDSLPEHIICGGTEEVYIDQYLESCIPFQSETVGKSGDFQVYWIFPSDKLLDCLPDYISEPMRLELINTFNQTWGGSPVAISPPQEKESDGVSIATINEEVKSAPCNFIPSFCEGVSGLDNLNAYPNPVTDQLNIDVILSRSKTIQYRVFDISGRVLNDELPIRDYSEAGRYTEQINLQDLKSGIYILVLTDNEGGRMTKRILKN